MTPRRRISAVITHYRNGEFLQEAVESVLAQTRPPDELLVVDDATPAADATALGSLPPSVILIRQPVNRGAGSARQAATDRANGDWIAYLDADDKWVDTKLEAQEAFLDAHPGAVAVHTGTQIFSAAGPGSTYLHKPAHQDGSRSVLQGEIVPSSLLVERAALLEVGGWSADRRLIEDWDLEIRLTNGAGPLWFLAECLTLCRRSGHGNLSSRPFLNVSRQLRTIWRHRALTTSLHGRGVWRAVAGRVIGDEVYKAAGLKRAAIWSVSRALRIGAPPIPPH